MLACAGHISENRNPNLGAFYFFAALLLCAGPIPKELGALIELSTLSLFNNKLTGERRGNTIFCFKFKVAPLDSRIVLSGF